MDWSKDTSSTFLSLIGSAYSLGFGISCLLLIKAREISPFKKSIFCKFLIFLASGFFTLPNGWLMVASRFVSGLAVGFLLSSGNANTHQAAIPDHRVRAIPMLAIYASIAIIFTTVMGLIDDGGIWIWRVVYWVLAAIALADFLIQVTFLMRIEPTNYVLRQKSEEKALKMLNYYLTEEESKSIVDEFSTALGKY